MSKETLKKEIKDIEEFTKLFKINIPIQKEFEYFIETLKKSSEYSYLDSTINSYIDLENFVSENGYKNVREYKNECFEALVKFILSSKAYANLQKTELSKEKSVSRDHLNQLDEGQVLLSLDFKSANYSVLKTYSPLDTRGNELDGSWEKLCKSFGIHEALIKSKSFRQIVFGNTNPGRLQTLQKENMVKVRKYLQDKFGYIDEDFVFISHDEIILKVKNAYDVYKIQDGLALISLAANGMEIRTTIFELKKLKKNTFLKTIYFVDITNIQCIFTPLFSTLHGVAGNKFYMYFKKYILNEPLKEIDLMYYNDGELCTWIDEDIKKTKKELPHYEKPKQVISIKEAINEYSYLWNNMTEILPDMSNEEKRRVIEIVASSCKQCFQEESGCQCWNDD